MLDKSIKVIGLTVLMSVAALSQTNGEKQTPQAADAPKKFYHLNFVVQELENEKVINSRAYSGMTADGKGPHVFIRAGEKVPFATSSGPNTGTQYQQIDVGVSIDCQRLEETGNQVSLDIKAEISSVMENRTENPPPPSLPIIRNNQWEASVVLPLRQPSIIFASDDPASKHKMQLLLTVTPAR